MPSIGRGQTSDCSSPILDFFIAIGGGLVDVEVLEFQIFDTTGATPVQVYPLVLDERYPVDLTDCPDGDRLGQGHYVARWTAPLAENTGAHEITWFYKVEEEDEEQSFTESFEVLAATPSASSGYILIQEMRDEGVTVEMATDSRLASVISLASRYIDRMTRRWFEPRSATFMLDGTGTKTLFLDVPIIGIESITVDETLLDPEEYKVYNRHLAGLVSPDDRDDPRVERTSGGFWKEGQQNIEIVGTFGYTEPPGPSGQTPELIKHVTKLLVMRELNKLTDPDRFMARQGHRIASESTRDQSVSYGTGVGTSAIVASWTGDPEIDSILETFAGPVAMGAV